MSGEWRVDRGKRFSHIHIRFKNLGQGKGSEIQHLGCGLTSRLFMVRVSLTSFGTICLGKERKISQKSSSICVGGGSINGLLLKSLKLFECRMNIFKNPKLLEPE